MRRRIAVPLVCLALLPLAACDALFGPGRGDLPPELTTLPRALSVGEQEVIRASNRFAFDLLRETVSRTDSANVFLSPLSASMALGMTMNGARGTTLDGMRGALGFGDVALRDINESYRDLIALLRGLDRAVDTKIANSVWARAGFPFHDEFLETTRSYFDAQVTALDFAASDAAATINRWVDRNTNGRIKQIVDDPIDADVVMYLINAIYFKGDWRHRFDRGQTGDAPFTLADGSRTTVRMMRRTGPAYYHAELPGVQVLEQVYGRSAFAMTIVLPPPNVNVRDLVATLDEAQWNAWLEKLRENEVHVAMPRFRLEYGDALNEPLIALGMGAAFRRLPGTDFTGMSPRGLELYISDVRQKTFLDVHEEGTEAAAVTSVEMRVVSAPPSVVIDRPFILAIRERLSGTIVFLGMIGWPRA
jgi:serine protease inhibitor